MDISRGVLGNKNPREAIFFRVAGLAIVLACREAGHIRWSVGLVMARGGRGLACELDKLGRI